MSVDSDKVNLITTRAEVASCDATQEMPLRALRSENIPKIKSEKTTAPKAVNTKVITEPRSHLDEAAEERQRTGRYLAVGVTLVMLFIAFYNTVLRHATVLAGLLAPAIIMLLYILWLLYFAKKRKTQVSTV